jgi:hypothetical protein
MNKCRTRLKSTNSIALSRRTEYYVLRSNATPINIIFIKLLKPPWVTLWQQETERQHHTENPSLSRTVRCNDAAASHSTYGMKPPNPDLSLAASHSSPRQYNTRGHPPHPSSEPPHSSPRRISRRKSLSYGCCLSGETADYSFFSWFIRVFQILFLVNNNYSLILLCQVLVQSLIHHGPNVVTGSVSHPGRGRPTNTWLVGPRRTVL